MSTSLANGSSHGLDHGQALNSLHEAAVAFNSPDPVLRSRGEAVFISLRQSPDAIELVLYALEHSRDAFVHFQCLSVLLERLAYLTLHSPSKSLTTLEDLRDYLLTLIHRHVEGTQEHAWWPQYTRARACQALAAVQVRLVGLSLEHERQRGGLEHALKEQARFITEHLFDLKGSRSHTSLLLTAALLAELGNVPHAKEKSSGKGKNAVRTARSQDHTGLSSLQHRWVRAWLQESLLNTLTPAVLHFISTLLDNVRSMDDLITLTAAVSVLEKLLRWQPLLAEPWAGLQREVSFDEVARLLEQDEYAAYDDVDVDGEDVSSSARQRRSRILPDSIAGTYLNVDVISLLAATYHFVNGQDATSMREVALCTSKLRDCILLVSSFSSNTNLSNAQYEGRRDSLLATVGSMQANLHQNLPSRPLLGDKGNALLFHVDLLNTILAVGDPSKTAKVSKVTEPLSNLTGPILNFVFEKREDSDEEEEVASLADELVRHLLACWTSLLSHSESDHSTYLAVQQHIFPAIVQPFIDGRLRLAVQSVSANGNEESEVGDENVSDYEAYDDSLTYLAMLARKGDLAQCLSHLQVLTDTTLNNLAEYYKHPSQGELVGPDLKSIEAQWESLHWIFLMSGHILADVSKGEIAAVPQECSSLNLAGQQAIVQIIDNLGLGVLQMLAEASPTKMQSPQVIQSAIWFNARWIPGYLLTRTSATLSLAYDGEGGLHRLQALLLQTDRIVASWLSDADVIGQVAALLRSLSMADGVMKTLLTLPEFGSLVRRIVEGLGSLPAATHKSLIASLVGCIYASDRTQSPEAFFKQITDAIAQRLSAVVNNPQFGSSAFSQSAETIENLLAALDMLDGVAASTQPKSARAVFDFLSGFFDTLVGLTQLYKERGEVLTAIIRVLCTLTGALDLGFGVPDDIVQGLNSIIWKLFAGEISSTTLTGDSIESAMEDDKPFECLCLLIDLLDDLLLATDGDEGDPTSEWLAPLSNSRTGDVSMYGFSRLVPMLQGPILAVPAVRSRFAHLTSQIFVLFSHRLVGLVLQENIHQHNTAATQGDCARLHATCIQALVMTLQFDEPKAIADSLEAINALASATRRVVSAVNQHSPTHQQRLPGGELVIVPLLSPLLDNLIRALILEPLAPSTMDWFVQTLRKVIDTIVTTNVQWHDTLDGRSHLQAHLEHFCATTSLESSRTQQAHPQSDLNNDNPAHRHALASTVSQLAQACVRTLSNDVVDLKEYGDHARQTAWNGRTQLQVR